MKEREPPDSWEMEFSDALVPPQPAVQKPWKGAAGLIPKTPEVMKRPISEPKEVDNHLYRCTVAYKQNISSVFVSRTEKTDLVFCLCKKRQQKSKGENDSKSVSLDVSFLKWLLIFSALQVLQLFSFFIF